MSAYATASQLSQYLPQAVSGDNSQIFTDVLVRARSAIDEALGFNFFTVADVWGSASAKKVRCIPGSRWFRLRPYKAGSVTTILDPDGTAVTDHEEAWNESRYSLYRYDGWLEDYYTVTAIWGFGPPPEVVVQINLALAVNFWRARDKGGYTEIIGAEGGGAIRVVGELTKAQRETLDNIRREYVDQIDYHIIR